MKMAKKLLALAFLGSVLMPATGALAATFTFTSNDGSGTTSDMMDLDHYSYYGWSIANSTAAALGAQLSSGSFIIQSATLQFKNIYNWVYETNDQLNSFLLSSPPPVPGTSEAVPVVINGVPKGHNLYTYTKTTVTTTVVKTTSSNASPPSGYTTLVSKVWNGSKWVYTWSKTTVSTKTNITGVPPTGYTQTATKFVPDMVTLGNGVKLSDNLWSRVDNQSLTDVNWGVESFRIQDINGDPMNPWHDETGGVKKTWTLTYDLNEDSINALYEYALNGSFGIGIDPDCHYYNDGVILTVVTAPIPEPETYAMLLAGLGLLGFAARRRKLKDAVTG